MPLGLGMEPELLWNAHCRGGWSDVARVVTINKLQGFTLAKWSLIDIEYVPD